MQRKRRRNALERKVRASAAVAIELIHALDPPFIHAQQESGFMVARIQVDEETALAVANVHLKNIAAKKPQIAADFWRSTAGKLVEHRCAFGISFMRDLFPTCMY